jgi:hypothetical protein
MKYWEIIADNLSKAGWSWGFVSALDSQGRTIWIADAHRDDGKRLVVRADEKLTAFRELESWATNTTPLLRFGFTDCTRTKGKSEVKRAALSQLRLDPYSSRMFFDHHFCNVESKSYTATILIMYL